MGQKNYVLALIVILLPHLSHTSQTSSNQTTPEQTKAYFKPDENISQPFLNFPQDADPLWQPTQDEIDEAADLTAVIDDLTNQELKTWQDFSLQTIVESTLQDNLLTQHQNWLENLIDKRIRFLRRTHGTKFDLNKLISPNMLKFIQKYVDKQNEVYAQINCQLVFISDPIRKFKLITPFND